LSNWFVISQVADQRFPFVRTLKLGAFHIGSSAADLLVTAVWNRIMIVDLGMPAWPVALLSAIRYFLAPLSLWAGHRSDTRPIFGSRRLAYIWLGRAMMLLSMPLLPISTAIIADGSNSGWVAALLSFVLFGSGTLISGPAFLALVHDSVSYVRRGLAISVVQFVLVASFAFLPLTFARIMPEYSPMVFMRLTLMIVAGSALIWFLSVWREERPSAPADTPDFRSTISGIWSDLRTRRYAVFLGASAFFAFMQDAILEPFGGDVFDLPVGETTRFNAFWGGGVLVSMIITMLITRRWRPDQQVGTTSWGLALLAIPLIAIGGASWAEQLVLVRPLLVLFGLGFGVFTVGGVSLLMAMSSERYAAAYLALWSVIQLVSRGLGIAVGGSSRDLALLVTGQLSSAYALVFWLEAMGALLCIWLLLRVDVRGFASVRSTVQAAAD
jgi:BCD family chlorophyll transporter-like MFS transporter